MVTSPQVSGCFQDASEAPISELIGPSEQRRKTANWRGPEACLENGSAAALLVGYVSILDMRPPRALPAVHFEPNDVMIICETVHWCPFSKQNCCERLRSPE